MSQVTERSLHHAVQLDVRTMCDLTNSDMEVQRCELKFGSWVYNAHQLDLLNVSQFMIKADRRKENDDRLLCH